MNDVAVRDELISNAGPDPLARQRFGRFRALGGKTPAQFGKGAGRVDFEAPLGPEDFRELAVKSNLHIVTCALAASKRIRDFGRAALRVNTAVDRRKPRPTIHDRGFCSWPAGRGSRGPRCPGDVGQVGVSSECLATFMARTCRPSDDPYQFPRIA
jgi:hypothetical protein